MKVGKYELVEAKGIDERDPRGLVLMYEPPRPRANYVLGCDPTHGISGWHRSLRVQEDVKTDNAAIEILRCGNPDVQVCEFAAPIDPYDLAVVVNLLGRLYHGANEDEQCLACIEVYPGPGWATQNELVNRFGYLNLPPWRYEDGLLPKITKKFGWYSTRSTRRDLWIKSSKHISEKRETINSPYLVEEMVDCTPDNFLAPSGRGLYGAHDDRVMANNLAIWYAHEWSLDWAPPEDKKPELQNVAPWQASAVSYEDMMTAWGEKFSSIIED